MGKSKFTRVRYLRVRRSCLEIVHGLSAQEKALFLDTCLAWFLKLEHGEEIELVDTGNYILNVVLQDEMEELQEGFTTYMDNANKRKKALQSEEPESTADAPGIHPGSTLDTPQTHPTEQTTGNDKHIQIEKQIISDLVRHGYSSSEIEKAMNTVDCWDGIENKTGYVRRIIDNQRKAPKKTVSAQNYEQRNYEDVQEEIMRKQSERIIARLNAEKNVQRDCPAC